MDLGYANYGYLRLVTMKIKKHQNEEYLDEIKTDVERAFEAALFSTDYDG